MPVISRDVRNHLALALIPGLGPKLTAAVLEAFGSAEGALHATASQLRTLPHIGDKLASALAGALHAVDIEPELRLLEAHGVTPVPLGYTGYPTPLAGLVGPPPLLYFRGSWLSTDSNAVAIVGSRNCTAYGRRMAELLARGLAHAGITVVSGLARGIDGVAHRAALEAGGRTLAVLAGGLAQIYPPEHADLAGAVAAHGCLVTETPMTVAPQPGMFPARNRIISGLSRAVIIVEANVKSGALITTRHAAEQGREVFAVPGNVDSPASAGCLELLRNGARVVRSVEDVLDDLRGPATADDVPENTTHRTRTLFDSVESASEPPPSPPPPQLEGAQRTVYELLISRRHGDELAREAELSVSELARVLMQLEMKRIVRRLPGNYYERR